MHHSCSRAAANARALTHASRSLWHRRLTRHTHTSTHLTFPTLNPRTLGLYKLLAFSVVTLTLLGLLCSNLDPSPTQADEIYRGGNSPYVLP